MHSPSPTLGDGFILGFRFDILSVDSETFKVRYQHPLYMVHWKLIAGKNTAATRCRKLLARKPHWSAKPNAHSPFPTPGDGFILGFRTGTLRFDKKSLLARYRHPFLLVFGSVLPQFKSTTLFLFRLASAPPGGTGYANFLGLAYR